MTHYSAGVQDATYQESERDALIYPYSREDSERVRRDDSVTDSLDAQKNLDYRASPKEKSEGP